MELTIRELSRKDYRKISRFAAEGMHFDRYCSSSFLVDFFGIYFFLSQLIRSTQVIAAYAGDEPAGVIMAAMKDEKARRCPWYMKTFVHLADRMSVMLGKDGLGDYDAANQELISRDSRAEGYDGEICFLAADPKVHLKGVGTALVEELARRERGKTVYLYTDSSCTYQFYDHRGFESCGEKLIHLDVPEGKVPLQCFLYSKTL